MKHQIIFFAVPGDPDLEALTAAAKKLSARATKFEVDFETTPKEIIDMRFTGTGRAFYRTLGRARAKDRIDV